LPAHWIASGVLSNLRAEIKGDAVEKCSRTLFYRILLNEQADENGRHKPGSNEIVIQFMASAFVGVVEWWIKNNMPRSPQYMAQHLWDIFEKQQLFSPEMAKSPLLS
jgi:hypothetical protein